MGGGVRGAGVRHGVRGEEEGWGGDLRGWAPHVETGVRTQLYTPKPQTCAPPLNPKLVYTPKP